MPAAAWVTIVIAALIVAAAALGLVRVIFHLMAIRTTLRSLIGGVQRRRREDQHRARPCSRR